MTSLEILVTRIMHTLEWIGFEDKSTHIRNFNKQYSSKFNDFLEKEGIERTEWSKNACHLNPIVLMVLAETTYALQG
jgi:hypothetical protein